MSERRDAENTTVPAWFDWFIWFVFAFVFGDFGFKNIRLRGTVRVILGICYVSLAIFLFGWTSGKGTLQEVQRAGGGTERVMTPLGLALFLGLLVGVTLLLCGLFRLLFGRRWNEVEKWKRVIFGMATVIIGVLALYSWFIRL